MELEKRHFDILILEDNPRRMVWFNENMSNLVRSDNYTIYHADNVEDAKILFDEHDFDLYLLDHDLGGEQMVDSSEDNTGYQFAKWMAEERDINGLDAKIYIHSLNPTGAENIRRCFTLAQRVYLFDY